jgi:hypothetical protein
MINPAEIQKDNWLKTSTGKYARVLSIDPIERRVYVTLHDRMVNAITLLDGSNTHDFSYGTVKSWSWAI